MQKNDKNNNRIDINLTKEISDAKTGLSNNIFSFSGSMSIQEFAFKTKKSTPEIIAYYFKKGIITNNNTVLSEEQIADLCLNFNFEFEKKAMVNETNILANLKFNDDPKDLVKRPPIVTIMGHVDHGKTTILDYIRRSNVAKGESGGITQHIGAYQISYNNNNITFIDTPGHEAFSAMRARGASITDIIVLIVAADDGFKPQTEESVKLAQSANVPVIVFINKVDKPNINIDKIMGELADHKLTPEEWGGSTMVIQGSGLTGKNIDQLLQAIITLGEVLELKGNPKRLAQGIVLESSVDKGLGVVATLIIKNGTLLKGDAIIAGSAVGNIRLLLNDQLKSISSATLSQPVKITGLNKTPNVGDGFLISNDKAQIKALAHEADIIKTNENYIHPIISSDPNVKNVFLVIKTDVHGSLEAIKTMLQKLKIENTALHILRTGVGAITENDVNLAKSAKAVIIGFNIKPIKPVRDIADQNQVQILFYNVIYKLFDDVGAMLVGQLEPEYEEKETGEAKILQLWQHSLVGVIAGCKVTSGEINRNDNARVLRDGVVLHQTKIGSMKHVKEVVNKATNGTEFGITLEKFNDLKVGDIIQSFKLVEVKHEFK